ncbi:MAG: alkylmercury lyase [Actinomycetota bacterium]|nr:alkylmercury lyase [Actinomycetota bacterium]
MSDPGLERAVRQAGFAALLGGRCHTVAELAAAAGVPEDAAASVIAALVAAGRATTTPDGRLDGIAGVTSRPTRHSVERAAASAIERAPASAVEPAAAWARELAAGSPGELAADSPVERPAGSRGELPAGSGASFLARISTWCAFDAVAIPAALRWCATAVTTCGFCGAELRVALVDGVPEGDAWGWLPPGDCEHVLRDFCATADLFCDRVHLDLWRAATADPPGEPRPVIDLAELGRAAWEDCLPPAFDSR